MLSKEFIKILEEKSDTFETVIIYCDEIFQYMDLEDGTFETESSTINIADCDEKDFNFYSCEELEIEDDIFDFIKDYKKVLKSVQNFNVMKKMTLFVISESFIVTEEGLEEMKSLEFFRDYGDSISLYELTPIKNPGGLK